MLALSIVFPKRKKNKTNKNKLTLVNRSNARKTGSATRRYLVIQLSGGWNGICKKKPTYNTNIH